MTKDEAAIIMAYTGITIGSPAHFHKFAEKLLGREIFIHEFANQSVMQKLKDASMIYFLELNYQTVNNDDDEIMENKECDHINGYYSSSDSDVILRKTEVKEDQEAGVYFTCDYKFKFCPDCGEKLNEN